MWYWGCCWSSAAVLGVNNSKVDGLWKFRSQEKKLCCKRNHTLALRHFIFKITRLIDCSLTLLFTFYSCWLMKWFQIDCFCLYCLLALEDTCQKKFEGELRRVVSVETQHNLLNVLKERACQLSMSEWQRIEIWSIWARFSSFFAMQRVIGYLSTMILRYDGSVGENVAKNILFALQSSTLEDVWAYTWFIRRRRSGENYIIWAWSLEQNTAAEQEKFLIYFTPYTHFCLSMIDTRKSWCVVCFCITMLTRFGSWKSYICVSYCEGIPRRLGGVSRK